MMVAVNVDVIGRDFFNHPIAGTTEFLGLSIVAVVFLQIANTAREGRHINNDLIMAAVSRINPRVARLFYALFELVAAALFGLIVWFVWPNFIENYQGGYFKGTTGYVEIPLWPFRAVVLIGAAAASIQHYCWPGGNCAPHWGRDDARYGDRRIVRGREPPPHPDRHAYRRRLMFLSFLGVWAIKGLVVAGKLLASSVTTSIASDDFGVIPLFVMMGLFVSVTAMGRDTFDVAAQLMRRLRGGLGIATVAANAVFAACTGTSIASASIFTKVAVPEMVRHGHGKAFPSASSPAARYSACSFRRAC